MNEDWLERALAGAEPRIADDGFTQRVMRALPPQPARVSARFEWLPVGAAAAASAIVLSEFPLAPFLNLVFQSAQIPWIGGAVLLGLVAGALLADPLRRVL